MPSTSPAEISAETAAATRTEYNPALAIDDIHPHPQNIRHDAIADDELVTSIRETGLLQPLVVTPDDGLITGLRGGYLLVAGHRRLDGLRKAGFTQAPAIIRHDLDDVADQVAAMLVENGRRADLTPLEEAEGFDLLTELGWKPEQIAAASGRSKTTIAARRKLTRLSETAREKVHTGQISIDDAMALTALPPNEQKTLEKHLGISGFKYEIERARARVEAARRVEEHVRELVSRLVPERTLDKRHGGYINFVNHADDGMVTLQRTGVVDEDGHPDCLAFVRCGTAQHPRIELVCTEPGNHDDQLSEVQRESVQQRADAEAERERKEQERREKLDAERVALQLRLDTLLAAVKPNQKLDPVVDGLLRLVLPEILRNPDHGLAKPAVYQDVLALDEDQRWIGWEPGTAYLESFRTMTTPELVRHLAVFLADQVENTLSVVAEPWQAVTESEQAAARRYFALLDQAGHDRNPLDDALLSAIVDRDTDDAEAGA